MKKLILATLIACSMLAGCGEDDRKTIDGITYGPYGLFNAADDKNPNIQYDLSGWNLFLGVIFSETLIVPIYIFGFDIMVPVGKKDPNWVKGQVSPAK